MKMKEGEVHIFKLCFVCQLLDVTLHNVYLFIFKRVRLTGVRRQHLKMSTFQNKLSFRSFPM